MNSLKTTILLASLTGFLVAFGYMFGGSQMATVALICAGVMNFIMFWFSDKIVLKMYKAQQIGPQDAPKLYAIVERLAQHARMPMPKVYVINTETPNAFATGRSPSHASVAATVGIMRLLSDEELEGVMAHELAHVKNRDTLTSTVAATLAGAITWLASMAKWGAVFGGRGGSDRNGNIWGVLAMAILAPIAAMIIQMAISRSREYAADKSGALMCGKPNALASALDRLQSGVSARPLQGGDPSTAHMFIINPFRGGAASLFSTHPPIEERTRRLRSMKV
ncbi:MAG: zinc metalloprotease HtpX [Chitinispirillales bacterium]|jgi:heat shock protein HtpX|nr:zinc metalloprotease HtpX [Chitinispirillales bacterium]